MERAGEMFGKTLKKLFARDYEPFAKELGYETWKEAKGNSFAIFYSEVDAWWFATELSDNQWAVWNNEGQMPHPFTVFSTWKEAISYLRRLFEETGLPEDHWSHEGWKAEPRPLIDKETQIKVLLYGKPYDFACETLGVSDMRRRKYSDVFTVTKDEVYEYTIVHGIPQSEPTGRDFLAEGFHYYEEEGKWYTFFRERGQIHGEKNFEDEELGKRYIVTTLLKLCGTGVY